MALKSCGEKYINFENVGRQSTWLKAIWCSKINMNMNESIGKVFVGPDFFGGCTFILPIIDLNWCLWGTPWFINSLLKTTWSHLQMVFGYASDYQREGWGIIALLGTWEVVNLSWSVTLSSDNLQCTSQHKSTNPSQKMSEEKQRFLSSKAWSNGRNLTEKCWFLRFLLNSIFMPSHHEQLPESQLSVKMHHKST